MEQDLLEDIEEELIQSKITIEDMDHELLRGIFNRLNMLIENQIEYIQFLKSSGEDTSERLENEGAFLGILSGGLDRAKQAMEKLISQTVIPKNPYIERAIAAGGKKRKPRKTRKNHKLKNK